MPVYQKNMLMIIGATVGAGIFFLPIALKQIGLIWFVGLVLLLGLVMMRINYFYSEVVMYYKDKHQMPGYVAKTLGKGWGTVTSWILLFSTFGTLLAYAIMGGTFLSEIMPISPRTGTYLFYILAAGILLFFGRKQEEQIDVKLSLVKSILFIVIILISVGMFAYQDIVRIPLFGIDPYLMYGSILFALTGFSIIPELQKDKTVRHSITYAQIFIIALYMVFGLVASRYVQGEQLLFPNTLIAMIFSITGFIAVFTPYLMFSLVSQDILEKDMKKTPQFSLGVVATIPFFLILFVQTGFLSIISFTGGVFLGALGFVVCYMYNRIFPHKHRLELYGIELLLLLGILSEIRVFFVQ